MDSSTLEPRQCDYVRYGRCYRYGNSSWGTWGRWVLLAGLIVAALLIFFLFSCITARRRRKRGSRPVYGTGWLAPNGQGQNNYYGPGGSNAQPQYGQPAPVYGGGNGAANDYYGQQNGMQMQPPGQTYQPTGGMNVYSPPPGAPPNKYGGTH